MKITNFLVTNEHPIRGEIVTAHITIEGPFTDENNSKLTFYTSTEPEDSSSWSSYYIVNKTFGRFDMLKSPHVEGPYTVSKSVGTIIYFKAVLTDGTSTIDTYDDLGMKSVACVVSHDPAIQPEVPVIDIVFTHDETGGTSDIKKRTLTFSHPVISNLLATGMPRAATKINRSLSKNVIYINFPTQAEDSGGYGYDLGFVEDTFTFTIVTTDWKEYERVFTLCKCNTGEVSGMLHVGKINNFREAYPYSESTYTSLGCKTYRVILRSSDADFDPGTYKITYTIKCTIVYNGA